MRKNKNSVSKIGLIFIILIFSLASVSVSYGGFFDRVKIKGDIDSWLEPASISDYVWNDVNQNGLQDDGESGVQSVTVNLYLKDGTFVATTTTNENGFYIFEDLTPYEYYLEFMLPEFYSFTIQNNGDDSVDSDVDPYNGLTQITFLESGENDVTWDAGLYTLYEGCSHGFWKNHEQKWQFYNPEDLIGDVFVIPSELDELSLDNLHNALRFNKGEDLIGSAKILLRNAVGSVLNAAHSDVNYPLTELEIIEDVNDALASLDRDVIIDLEEDLDYYNNLHNCELCG